MKNERIKWRNQNRTIEFENLAKKQGHHRIDRNERSLVTLYVKLGFVTPYICNILTSTMPKRKVVRVIKDTSSPTIIHAMLAFGI